MTIKEIAKQLHENANSIILIYAFNATGKTQLSVAYKNYSKAQNNGNHTGVYYNAFSEDLFNWDNDEENDNANIKLDIKYSSLNQFHSLLTSEAIEEKLALYHPRYIFEINSYEDLEKGIESISFYENDKKQVPIKISRGEERIFVWCFFLTLFEIDSDLSEQNAHFFIDDPVSSLDEHNIYVTANSIFKLIEDSFDKKRKILITTHHIGLFSILSDRLKKGEKSGRYEKITKLFVLHNEEGDLQLKSPRNDVFLFHLHLLQTLDEVIHKNQIYKYHFVLLRQLLENISSFLGSGKTSFCLEQIGVQGIEEATNMVNSLSHQNAYRFQSHKMSPPEEEIFKEVFDKLQDKYHFRF